MNSGTDLFTRPVLEIYIFKNPEWIYFPLQRSLNLYDKEIAVALYLNGIEITLALADEEGDADKEIETYDMESTLNIMSGDQLWAAIKYKSTDTKQGIWFKWTNKVVLPWKDSPSRFFMLQHLEKRRKDVMNTSTLAWM